MTLSLDFDTLLDAIHARAIAITGIRGGFRFDEWPDSLPSMPSQEAAWHLTGFPEEGQGVRYMVRGTDLSEYEVEIPLYTIVVEAAKVRNSRKWVAPYFDRYRAAFDTRTAILDVGTGNTGSILYTGAQVVRAIPDWDNYSGYFMLRHTLMAHVKGPVSRD